MLLTDNSHGATEQEAAFTAARCRLEADIIKAPIILGLLLENNKSTPVHSNFKENNRTI